MIVVAYMYNGFVLKIVGMQFEQIVVVPLCYMLEALLLVF